MNTFVVANPNKCIGCKSCEIACAAAHLDVSVITAGSAGVPFSPRINLIRQKKLPCRYNVGSVMIHLVQMFAR
ncbi:hypothetical protein [Clostridium ljungdahlii]|uniref:hypothetical protein n=1 Tax=Clostridium ljungdahlii TaxID=1538 RepID=UPI00386AAC59